MKRSYKVLHIDTQQTWRGGEAQVFLLCRGLKSLGHESFVATQPDAALAAALREISVPSIQFPMRGEFDLKAAFRIFDISRRRGIDIIHAHDSHGHALAWLATMRIPEIPVVVTRRVDFPVGGNLLSLLKYKSSRVFLIAISKGVKKVLKDGGVPEDRIEVVFSGVDPERFKGDCDGTEFRKKHHVKKDEIIIGNVGALTDHKGQIYLIDAAPDVLKRFPGARFFIIGKGELMPVLKERIRELGLGEKITLTGFVKEIEEALSAMDLFVLSSHLEGLCTSLLDAMLMKVPIVATKAGGIPDAVTHGENGILVEPKNPDALANGIIRLLEDREMQEQFTTAGYEKVMKTFIADKMVEGTARYYEKVLKHIKNSEGEKT